ALVASLPTSGRRNDDATDRGAVQARIAVKAGPRMVGISLRHDYWDSERRYPKLYPWGNSAIFNTTIGAANYMKIQTVEIAGRFNSTGLGDTPSRRRIFSCQPARPSAEEACAKKILSGLARRAFRRPVTAADVEPLMAQYRTGKQLRGDFTAGIQ